MARMRAADPDTVGSAAKPQDARLVAPVRYAMRIESVHALYMMRKAAFDEDMSGSRRISGKREAGARVAKHEIADGQVGGV